MHVMITCVDSSNQAYMPMSAAISNLEIAPPVIVVVLTIVAHVMLSVAVAYSILDCEWWVKWCSHCFCVGGKLGKSIEIKIENSVQAVTPAGYNVQCNVDYTLADKQSSNTLDRTKLAKHQSYCVKSFDDGNSFNEGAFTSGYFTTSSNYSDFSFRSKFRSRIVPVGAGNVNATRSVSSFVLHGIENLADKAHDIDPHTTKISQEVSPEDDCLNKRAVYNSVSGSTALGRAKCEDGSMYATKQNWEVASPLKQVQKESPVYTQDEASRRQIKHEPVKTLQETTLPSSLPVTGHGYNKATYAVLVGNVVKVYSTNTFASLPHNNKFLVKERRQDPSGVTKVKLALKQSTDNTKRYVYLCSKD